METFLFTRNNYSVDSVFISLNIYTNTKVYKIS